eukprot:TRINITY_DN16834_c0_g1_i2.p1 TRINITY_DN16834_c0_g1~~TRINITY_DN16834_c0_g1_i2.p1  ORF type:complete len:360 (+),score=34.66 TRINITY_DN16834_c0_g1_i2:94-1173(+)
MALELPRISHVVSPPVMVHSSRFAPSACTSQQLRSGTRRWSRDCRLGSSSVVGRPPCGDRGDGGGAVATVGLLAFTVTGGLRRKARAGGSPRALRTALRCVASEAGRMVATELVYMQSSELREIDDCRIVSIKAYDEKEEAGNGLRKLSLVLDRTIFHPQGGGQRSDIGTLVAPGLPPLAVTFVSLDKASGVVAHDGVVDTATAKSWLAADRFIPVKCCLDPAHRSLSERLHSAGHLLDVAVSELGLQWIAGKGYHFTDGTYVEYRPSEGSPALDFSDAAGKAALVTSLQSRLDSLIDADHSVTQDTKDGVRHIRMVGELCPCGGTHVRSTGEIGQVTISKIKKKKGNIRVSYELQDPA